MTPTQSLINMLLFAITFFLTRIVFGPYSWYRHCYDLYTAGQDSDCISPIFPHVIFVTGLFFNVLNAYWFYKIILKLQRKLVTKEEAIHDSNELNSINTKKVA